MSAPLSKVGMSRHLSVEDVESCARAHNARHHTPGSQCFFANVPRVRRSVIEDSNGFRANSSKARFENPPASPREKVQAAKS